MLIQSDSRSIIYWLVGGQWAIYFTDDIFLTFGLEMCTCYAFIHVEYIFSQNKEKKAK